MAALLFRVQLIHVGAIGLRIKQEVEYLSNDFTCQDYVTVGAPFAKGGHGEVYATADGKAMKIAYASQNEDFQKECDFQNELLSNVAFGGHVPACYAVCDIGGRPALVMDRINDPVVLEKYMRDGPTDTDAKAVAAQTYTLLSQMVSRHRLVNADQRPNANILVDASTTVWLIDFGMACKSSGPRVCAANNFAAQANLMATVALRPFKGNFDSEDIIWQASCCTGYSNFRNEVLEVFDDDSRCVRSRVESYCNNVKAVLEAA